MNNPQKENGYTAIANEIMEALSGIRISGEATQCLYVVLRKTYGFNKKEDKISLSQFVSLTKMPKATVCRALVKLAKMNIIIIKNDNAIANSYSFNKLYSSWRPLTKKIIVDKKDNGRWQKRQSALTIMGHTKETITKETITKESSKQSLPEIQEILNIFYKINPTLNFGNKTERNAVDELIKKFGFEKLKNTIFYAISIQGNKYSPVITTPLEFKRNLAKLMIYYKREQEPKKGSAPIFNL